MPYYIAEIRLNKTSKNVRSERKMGKRLIKHFVTILLVCVLIFASIMMVPAAVGSDGSDQSDLIKSSLLELSANVSKVHKENFTNPKAAEGQRKALCNKINAVINQIKAGAYEGAVNKLKNDLKNTIEKWIADEWWKNYLIKKVDNIIDLIEGIPVADANGPYSGYEGSPITFDASDSIDNDGTIDLYEWDWDNDGTYDESTISPLINHTWTDDFTGTVGLRVTDDEGLTDTDTASVTVYNVAPTVEVGPDHLVNEGDVVNFSGSFTDPGVADTHTFFWDFGDGSNKTGTLTPTHAYGDNGVYTVTLNVTDDDGGFGIDTLTVTVYNVAPTVDAGPDRAVYLGQTVNFTGDFDDPGWLDTHTIFWDFGDGSNATDTLTPIHNYTEAGVYTVTLSVTDDDGGFGTDTLKVTVSTVAVHDVAILSVIPNATKVIQGSAVNITVVAYDGGTETETFNVTAYANTTEIETQKVTDLAAGTQTTLSFIWDTTGVSLGSYTIKAVASTVQNETDTDDNTCIDGEVNVNTPPVASDLSIFPPSPKTTDDLVGSYTYYDTDGDSESRTEIRWYKNSTLQPAYNDMLTIPLSATTKGDVWYFTVRPKDGLEFGTLQTSPSVTILNSPPIADANGPYEGYEGSPITFNASGSSDPDGDVLQCRWDFDDDGTWDTEHSTDPTASYTWGDIYSGTVVVEVFDGGLTNTATATVTVNNVAPAAEAGLNQTVNVGETVYFNGSAIDPGWLDSLNYTWDFNATNGIQVDEFGQNVTHVYTESGNYTVTLTVTDDDGGIDTDELTVTVLEVVHEFPWALYAAVGLGIAALIATAFYLWYRRRKRKSSASTAASPLGPQTKPVVTLYIPASILAGYEEER